MATPNQTAARKRISADFFARHLERVALKHTRITRLSVNQVLPEGWVMCEWGEPKHRFDDVKKTAESPEFGTASGYTYSELLEEIHKAEYGMDDAEEIQLNEIPYHR